MPIVNTRDGFRWDVPEEWIRRGSISMPLRRVTREGIETYIARWVYDRVDDSWNRAEDRPFVGGDAYGDGFEAPSFDGWEVVANPRGGTGGDVYVCIDPNQREFRSASSPQLAMGHGDNYKVCPAWGDTKPSPGWRIYRKTRPLGPVRLLPSTSFSQPLPLP